jgi:hypothetical protein
VNRRAAAFFVVLLVGGAARAQDAPEPTPTPTLEATPTPETTPGPDASAPPDAEPTSTPTPAPSPTPPPDERPAVLRPEDSGLIPRLNLYLPEGQADFRLSKLIKNSLFENQFDYDFVSGDIAAFLRYKYYGVEQSLAISAFDAVRFRSFERFSQDYDRVRGVNTLLRRPLGYQKRLSFLAEFDRLSYSLNQNNPDNNRTNVYAKLGYQAGTGEDYLSNQISGDPNDRIRNLFTAYREIGPNGYGFSVAVTYGLPVASFQYVKAEMAALKILDLGSNHRLIGRLHAGFFPFRPYGSPQNSSNELPYRIPGYELFQLDGRDNLKGDKDTSRATNEVHMTLEGFVPVFINRNASFMKLTWNTLYAVLYAGTGNLGNSTKTFTALGDWKEDLGVGFEVSVSYRRFQVFFSGLVARVVEGSGSPKVLFTLRSVN